jgi:hypothetical protein
MSDERTQDRIALATLIARTPGLEQHWFYLQAPTMEAAVPRAHMLGLNPGGEVQIIGPISAEVMDAHCPVEMRERLLGREQIEAM